MIDIERFLQIVPNARFEATYLENEDKSALTRISARLVIDLTPAPTVMPQGSPSADLGNPDR
jgi:hypothetical protein